MQYTQSTLQVKNAELVTYTWQSNQPAKAVILILHGMGEHAERYAHFAHFLNQHDYTVRAQDHRGHGRTAQTPEDLGYFADHDGWNLVVEDVYTHVKQLKEEFPSKKLIILGHSMGSFMTQEFLIRHSDLVDAAVLSGSNGKPNLLARLGRWVAKFESKRLGKRGTSTLLENLSVGEFNKVFKPNRTTHDWLSRDENTVDEYVADPLCGKPSSTQLWVDLLGGIAHFSKPERQQQIRKDLPVFIFSGARDPVGLEGKGVRQLIDAYTAAGLTEVTYRFYHEGRHEMLNELNRQEVYEDILQWISNTLSPEGNT